MRKRFFGAVTAGAVAAVLGLAPNAAHAADNDRLVTSTAGAAIGLTVDWTSDTSFVLRNVYLKDTVCDGDSVFFYIRVSGYTYPNHRNEGGCNSTASWTSMPGSFSGGAVALTVTVCRDAFTDNCATSRASLNPYNP
ncbi:hypothetical protein ACFYY2_04140 [Streptomyces sp. NPDC001822]|uniref:hypothetical protein n=1 Tax=Streptomyces sp. NPDC001822 TaxID=3364614 RepID=UPI0036D0A083